MITLAQIVGKTLQAKRSLAGDTLIGLFVSPTQHSYNGSIILKGQAHVLIKLDSLKKDVFLKLLDNQRERELILLVPIASNVKLVLMPEELGFDLGVL